MFPRKSKYKARRYKLAVVLVALVAAFCVLSTLEDKYGLAIGLPQVESESIGTLGKVAGKLLEESGLDLSGLENTLPKAESPIPSGDYSLQVHTIDVGQGDSHLIVAPKWTVLIDGGENDKGQTVLRYLKEQKVDKIDLMIATHPHSDHIGGLDDVLDNVAVSRIVMTDLPEDLVPTTVSYTRLLLSIAKSGAEVIPFEPDKRFDLGGGASLTLLAPLHEYTDLNNMSVVSRLVYGETSFLFTGDACVESEDSLLEAGVDVQATVLDAGHHGSKTSSNIDFLEAVAPSIVTISCGLDNSYGHPHRQVMERLEALGVEILRTDLDGSIVIASNGEDLVVQTEK